MTRLRREWAQGLSRGRATPGTSPQEPAAMSPAAAYCAEVVAVTYQEMGLLDPRMPSITYDPGAFWSGDGLALTAPYLLGAEIGLRTA